MRALLGRRRGIEVVGEAEDGRAAVALAGRRAADLVVMDVRMPGMDGLEAMRLLAGPGVVAPVAVIVVTTYDLDEYVFDALQAGASGFLLKEAVPEELVPAIRAVGSGQGLIGAAVTRRLIAEYASLRLRCEAIRAATLGIEESTVKSHVSSLLEKLGLRSRVQAVIYAFEQGLVRVGRRGV